MHWRRKWQPTPVFLPGESQGWEAWWAAVYGVAQSRTQLKRLSSSSSSRGQKRQIPAVLRQSGRRKRGPETGVGGICGMSAAPHSLPRPDSYHLLLLTAQDAGQQLQWEAGSWASLELSPSVESCGCGLGPSPAQPRNNQGFLAITSS